MSHSPTFSVVMATFGRSRHIKPSIESVLGQTLSDFELIVIGDGCTDDTEVVVRSFAHENIQWSNLPQNTGSQSYPNNEGIRRARGDWICYIGHDDIWGPDHLRCLAETISSAGEADFVVSGCIYHGPPGSGHHVITGLFDAPDAASQHFFPPSSIAHRRGTTERIGEWRDPRVITTAVDQEILQRAAGTGLRFVSTRRITVHKFAAGHRYLSYLRPGSAEQQEMLDRLRHSRISFDEIIAAAKRAGLFMTAGYPEALGGAGVFFEQNRQNKGLNRPALQLLCNRVVMEQTSEMRGLDWYPIEPAGRPYRWSGPNPRPQILIPFSGERARFGIDLLMGNPNGRLENISLSAEGKPVTSTIESAPGLAGRLTAEIELSPDDYTVLALETPMFTPDPSTGDTRSLGVAVADIAIEPLATPPSPLLPSAPLRSGAVRTR
jgi:hypothetical protein